MAPTPADLRTAADTVRRSASFVTLAFEDVGPRGGDATWQGPAANVFRRGARQAHVGLVGVAEGLRATAARLDARADHLQAEIDAAAREAERRRAREEECRRREEAGASVIGGTRCGGGPPMPWPGPDGEAGLGILDGWVAGRR